MWERSLWSTRFVLLPGIAGCAILAASIVWFASVDLARFVLDVADYTVNEDPPLRGELVAAVVKIVDAYLLAAILIVVALGLYELFIGRLAAHGNTDRGPRLVVVTSLDDLKDRVGKLIILILVIEFFQRAVKIDTHDAHDLLLLAAGVALVALAVTLPGLGGAWSKKSPKE